MNKLLLIDGNSLFFRAYFATTYGAGPMLSTKSGFPTNGLVTFNNLIQKSIQQFHPTHLLIAFDKGSKTKRHKAFEGYKGKRTATPPALLSQLAPLREMLTLQGIKWCESNDWEADDIIATLSKQSLEQTKVIILSSDNDLLQLVSPNVTYFINKKGLKVLDEYNDQNFFTKLGFLPSQLADYKGLVGDSSDNLPGVAGVGPKTALKLLDQYKTLEEIYSNLEEINPALKTKLTNSINDAKLSKKLAILNLDVEIPFSFSDLKYQPLDTPELANFYEKYEMYSFLKKIKSDSNTVYEKIVF